jgi:hypothetical protein
MKHTVGLEEIEIKPDLHPSDIADTIDKALDLLTKYSVKLKMKNSRVLWAAAWLDLYTEWGVFSGRLNRMVRKRIKEKIDEDDEVAVFIRRRLSYCYAYWWNRHHHITQRLSKFSKHAGISTAKGIEKGRKSLLSYIHEVDRSRPLAPELQRIVDALVEKEYKPEFHGTLKRREENEN